MGRNRVRDPIHGLIRLESAEWDAVDTPIFQRLRGVQQLAMTHLVYPGARHSRFEHSIGCCEVAGRVADRLELSEEDRQLVRFAALLHDVGHGPFSHVSDDVFARFIDSGVSPNEVHERISAAIAVHDPRMQGALGDLAGPVSDLLAHRGDHAQRTLPRDIVSGPADIDKLDYLLRDSHYCGVNYGRYDLEKLTNSVVAIQDGREAYLGYRESAVYALEEMLLARYHMHRQVYGHKTRIASNLALTRAMVVGVEDGILPQDVFAPPAEPDRDFIEAYTPWTDAQVVHVLLNTKQDSRAKSMMRAVVERRLPKRVTVFDGDQLHHYGVPSAALRWLASPSGFGSMGPHRLERHVASSLGLPDHEVFVHLDKRGDPVSRPGTYGIDEKDVPLRMADGAPRTLQEVSQVFDTRRSQERLFIALFVWPLEDEGVHRAREAGGDALIAGLAEMPEEA